MTHFLTVSELITELRTMPSDMLVTVPMLAKDDPDSIIAQGDVQGADTNGDTVVLFVMEDATGDISGEEKS